MSLKTLWLTLLILTTSSNVFSVNAEEWNSFLNGRFGFSIEVPASFEAGPRPANDDGMTYTSDGGAVTLAVFGNYNVLSQTPETYLQDLSNDPDAFTSIEYQRQGRDWIVVSGFLGDDIVYQKTIFSCGLEVMSSMILTYPAISRSRFDPIVTRLSRSLMAGKGYGTPEDC